MAGADAVSRVLLVGKGAPERGGIPSFLTLLLESRLARDHDLQFLNLAGQPPAGGRFTGGNVMRTVIDAVRVWRAARNAEVVHIHSALAPGVTLVRAGTLALAGKLAGAHSVVHAHGGRIQLWLTTSARRRLARVVLSAADTVIAVSAGAAAALATALPDASVRLVENGVNVARFTSSPRNGRADRAALSILYVGVLTPRKGVVDLLTASDHLEGRGLAHEILLVGGIPDEGAAAGQAVLEAARERPGRISVAGPRAPEEMPAMYEAADIFCLPSWWEAMPLSVLEAMAAGLPVVATGVGDVGRLIEHGVNGLIVPPRDPDALAEALARLLTDRDLRRDLSSKARATVEKRWDAERTIAGVDSVYAGYARPGR